MTQYLCTRCGTVETLEGIEPDACPSCGASGLLNLTRAKAIADKNDTFRRSLANGNTKTVPEGRAVMTPGIAATDDLFKIRMISAVAMQTTFDEGNDPHREHDFGSVRVGDIEVWWKIDLYDAAYEYGSENPLDDTKTRRVLTFLLPSEY